MTVYTCLWIGLLAGLLIVEACALCNKSRGDTLSEHVWRWFSVREPGRLKKVRRLALLVIMLWLTIHFVTGGWI